jgi:capsular polysaccharide transport system ATP-binding protein
VIALNGLWKKYHGDTKSDWVLKNVNLNIPKGVSVGLVGQNGAGKSTLLSLIGGIDTPDKGSVETDCSVSWPIGLSGGFQGSMTGRQNVKFVARLHGGEYLVKKVVSYVEEFAELGSAFDRPVRTYSSGMRSRLAFGLSLAIDFDVYLSDEATAVGDAKFKEKATNEFKSRVGSASLIMVSHSEDILRDLCQSGIWMHDGSAFWFPDISDALDAYAEYRNNGTFNYDLYKG